MGDVDITSSSPARLTGSSLLSLDSMTPTDDPPPYEAVASTTIPIAPQSVQPLQLPRLAQPPQSIASPHRTFSVDALPPSPSVPDDRRELLLVWIHGFMGDEATFQSFPAHVHDLLSKLVTNTHVVHSKIYPRYKPKQELKIARDDFSKWLLPFQTLKTDVVILGHSMGGLVAAEVALMPGDGLSKPVLRHNVLGIIGLDAPFLGMHPGVLGSGIKNIFRPAPTRQPREMTPSTIPPRRSTSPAPSYHSSATTTVASSSDSFVPSYINDLVLPTRSRVMSAAHFINKTGVQLRSAVQQSIGAYMEFGSCLADYGLLKDRYTRIRMLEAEDPRTRSSALGHSRIPPRVRFINYYTTTDGIPKKTKSQTSISRSATEPPRTSVDEKRPLPLPTEMPTGLFDTDFPSASLSPTASHESLVLEDSDDDDISLSDTASTMSDLSEVNSINTIDTFTTTSIIDDDTDDDATPRNLSRTSTITPWEGALQDSDPPRFPRPPVRSDFGEDKTAYKRALKAYRKEFKDFMHEYKDRYVHSKKKQKEASKRSEVTFKEEWKSRIEVDRELQKAFNDASMEESKRTADAYKEESKAAAEAYREEWKAHMEVEKEHRKAWNGANADERSHIQETINDNRRALEKVRATYFAERKSSIEQWKDLRKEEAEMRRAALQALQQMQIENQQFFRRESKVWHKFERKNDRHARKVERKYKKKLNDEEVSKYSLPEIAIGEGAGQLYAVENESQDSLGRSETIASSSTADSTVSSTKDPKEKKFCALPPKYAFGGRDPAWVRIFIAGMDEVGAHCGLFFPKQPEEELPPGTMWSERYAMFVRDVAERIEGWANDAASQRVLEDMRVGMRRVNV